MWVLYARAPTSITITEDELTFAEKIEIVEKIFLAHFTFWVAETIYDYKS